MTKTAVEMKAQDVYMAKFKRPYVRLLPDEYAQVAAAADAAGESMNSYMHSAIMDRVKKEGQA